MLSNTQTSNCCGRSEEDDLEPIYNQASELFHQDPTVDGVPEDAEIQSAYADVLERVAAFDDSAATVQHLRLSGDAPAQEAAQITCEVQSLQTYRSDCQGETDELFAFSLRVSTPPSGDFRVRSSFDDGSPPIPVKVSAGEDLTIDHCFAKAGEYDVAVEDQTGDTTLAGRRVSVKGTGRYGRLLRAFRVTDTQMTLVAGLQTVGLGLSTLYFANASWGTPANYLPAVFAHAERCLQVILVEGLHESLGEGYCFGPTPDVLPALEAGRDA